jgi:hypothetical protein
MVLAFLNLIQEGITQALFFGGKAWRDKGFKGLTK